MAKKITWIVTLRAEKGTGKVCAFAVHCYQHDLSSQIIGVRLGITINISRTC